MNIKVSGTLASGTLVALLLSACGGGNGGGTPVAPAPASSVLTLAGTAATGLALADSTVTVKCAAGTGSATTNAVGAYTVNVENATLPCMLQVSGTASGTPVVLHSVVESGAATTGGTVTANVTPLTEMIVAQLAGSQPTALFDTFTTTPVAVTATQLQAATTAVVGALRTATGIDLGSIDPFKAPLVAATPTAPTAGNVYDRLLDQLGDKVPPAALPLVVTQIATAAAAAASAPAGSTPSVTLADVMTAVNAGAMPNCPQVPSGSYRLLDVYGRMSVRVIDFAAGTVKDSNGTVMSSIATDPSKPCEMTLTATSEGRGVTTPATTSLVLKVAMGPQGAGGYQSTRILEDSSQRHSVGYVFPVQSHPYSILAGTWLSMENGFYADEPNPWEHYVTRLDIPATPDTAIGECNFTLGSLDTVACTARPSTESQLKAVSAADGGFTITDGGEPAGVVYAFRAPNGTVTLFGSSNVAGAVIPPSGVPASNGVSGTSFIAKRPTPQVLPAVGSESRYWDLSVLRAASTRAHQSVQAPTADATTITAVDTAANSVTRSRQSDGRVDVLRYNRFTDGLRVREGNTSATPQIAPAILFPTGAGIVPVVNLNQSASATWFTSISVVRP
ncbi:MAG TPA: hypothetical protein VEA81_06520 [Burkholderiaceae bacterium]|nr:hypothetical protein [Burkholderiaceae bacterium]